MSSKSKRRLLFAVTVSFVMFQTVNPTYSQSNVLGVGSLLCSEVKRLSSDIQYRRVFIAWFGGYVSGVNTTLIVRDKKYLDPSSLNVDLIIGSIVSNCTRNPELLMIGAVDMFVQQLPLLDWQQ